MIYKHEHKCQMRQLKDLKVVVSGEGHRGRKGWSWGLLFSIINFILQFIFVTMCIY